MVELLACPWCGGPASVRPYGRRNWVASCKSDPDAATCPAVIDVGGNSRAEAIAAWNTRAPASGEREAVVEECANRLFAAIGAFRDEWSADAVTALQAIGDELRALASPSAQGEEGGG